MKKANYYMMWPPEAFLLYSINAKHCDESKSGNKATTWTNVFQIVLLLDEPIIAVWFSTPFGEFINQFDAAFTRFRVLP